MRFQWKLLTLFLVIALTPIILGRTFGLQGARLARDRLVSYTTDMSIERVKRQLLLLSDSYSFLLKVGRSRMELSLDYQVSEMERLMRHQPAMPEKVFTTGDFSKPDSAPLDMMDSAGHFRVAPDGSFEFLDVSYGYPVFTAAVDSVSPAVQTNVARLAAMVPVYRRVDEGNDHVVLWHYTAFADGPASAYPGHGGWPAGVDPRRQIWYQSAISGDAESAPWTHMFFDPITHQPVIGLSRGFHDAKGDIVGVTAMVVPVSRLMGHFQLNQHAPSHTQAFLTYLHPDPAGGPSRLLIITSDRFGQGGISRGKASPQEFLKSEDANNFSEMLADMEMGVKNIRRMPYKGQDSLWVYGSSGFNSALVLVTPYQAILEPARNVEQFISDLVEHMVRVTGYAVAVIIVVIIAAALLFSRTVTRPINKLAVGAIRLSEGDFNTTVDIRSRDEFGQMGRVFNMMGPRLRELSKVQHTLALAMEVQQRLLPHGAPDVQGLDIAGVSLYCDETGGDYYDYLSPRDGNPALLRTVVGDVAGHGIPSALLMASARAFIRQRAAMPGDMSAIMADVNRQLAVDVADSGRFLTLFFCEVDSHRRRLRWSNAGHEPAIVYHPTDDDFTELTGHQPPLGVLPAQRFAHHDCPVAAGDVILLLTDGVLETFNRRGEMFGREPIRDLIRQHAHRPAADIISIITGAVEQFREDDDQEDDITMVVVKVTSVD